MMLPAWGIVTVSRRSARRIPVHFDNHLLEERVTNLVDMLRLAKRDIVIVTGSLDHGLFADPRVVAAFRRLSARVMIELFFTGAHLDPKSAELCRIFRRRKVVPKRVIGPPTRHGLVVDRRDTKIEALGVPDGADDKHADYYLNEPNVAASVLAEIRTLNAIPKSWEEIAAAQIPEPVPAGA